MAVYKFSNAGGFTSKQRYTSMLVGNPAFNPISYESIATVSVGSGGASDITFTSIPSTYAHLQIRMFAKASTVADLEVRFNSDTASNYAFHYLVGTGSSVVAGGFSSTTRIGWKTLSATSNIFSTGILDLLDYASVNKNKTTRALSGDDFNGSGTVVMHSGLWLNSSTAVSSITLYPSAGTISQYSHFALYGIKGA